MTTLRPGTAFVLANLDLCELHARRIWRLIAGCVPYDDLLQEGRVGLLLAAERFDPGRNVTFRTFADRAVRGRILDSVRSWNHYRRNSLTPAPVSIALVDVHIAASDQLAREAALDIEHLAGLLTPRERLKVAEHLEMHAGYTTREIGKRRGITEAGQQDRLGKARRLLAKTARVKRTTQL